MFRLLRHVAICLCTSILLAQPALAVKVNSPAPDFTLKDTNGREVTLAGQRGKAVILNFWSTTCAPCVAEIPGLNTLYRELNGHGLVVIGIALDGSAGPVRELIARLRLAYPIVLDSDKEVYFDSYGLFGQPISVLVDRNGTVVEQIIGQVDWLSPKIRQKVQNLLKGR